MRTIILTILLLFCTVARSQQPVIVKGKVVDKSTGIALQGASVLQVSGKILTRTNEDGVFEIAVTSAGEKKLLISHVGYESATINVNQAESLISISLIPKQSLGNEVVVSASKRPEKITNAPASIRVIGQKELQQFSGSNVGELLATVPGVEYTRSGVDEINFNARGMNTAFNIKVFQIVDGRNTMASLSGGLPMFNNGSTNKEDIERIEIVLGPQSALYGPNAHNALINYISKHPRKHPGTSVAVSAGSQYQFSSRIRQAGLISTKWAYKFTGEYATGRDYEWYDSVKAGNQNGNQAFFGPAVNIPERIKDFTFWRYRAESQVYYSINSKTEIILAGGGSRFTRLQTSNNRNRLSNIGYGFLQGKLVHPDYYFTIYNTFGDMASNLNVAAYTRDFWNRTHSTLSAGPNRRLEPDSAEIFATRRGNLNKENSQRTNAEFQYNYNFQKAGLHLTAGVTYQNDRPNGYGLTLVDSAKKIMIRQYGAVVQLDKTLPHQFRFISTTRVDHHSDYGEFFAPRFALLKTIKNGTARVTWGKAYAMPSILNQYAAVNRTLFGNGGNGIQYIPNNSKFSDPASVVSTNPLLPEQVSTWELGYRGSPLNKLFVDLSYFNGKSKNFISPIRSVAGRAITVNNVAVTTANPGAVVNDTLKNAQFSTYFNYGSVKAYGVDVAIMYDFNKHIQLGLNYSWFDSDISKDNINNDANKDGFVSAEERSLNAPEHRGALILQLQNLVKKKAFMNITTRFVEGYDFYSGSLIGTKDGAGKWGIVERPGLPPLQKNFNRGQLGGFVSVDLRTGYKFNNMFGMSAGVTNVFNSKQIEFAGSPSIGRLIMVEAKVQIP